MLLAAGVALVLISTGNDHALAQGAPRYLFDPGWPKPLPNNWKIGGVTGLASALALAERGASVCLLEREGRTGRATSTHNSGVIHAGLYYPTGTLKARLCVEGRDRLYDFCAAHHVPYRRCGKLVVAHDAHDAEQLIALKKNAHDNGVTSVIDVDPSFVKQKEPNVFAVAALWSGGVPDGIRKPVRYQFDGRTQPGNRSSASVCPAQGPTRSSFRASTSLARTSRELPVD